MIKPYYLFNFYSTFYHHISTKLSASAKQNNLHLHLPALNQLKSFTFKNEHYERTWKSSISKKTLNCLSSTFCQKCWFFNFHLNSYSSKIFCSCGLSFVGQPFLRIWDCRLDLQLALGKLVQLKNMIFFSIYWWIRVNTTWSRWGYTTLEMSPHNPIYKTLRRQRAQSKPHRTSANYPCNMSC